MQRLKKYRSLTIHNKNLACMIIVETISCILLSIAARTGASMLYQPAILLLCLGIILLPLEYACGIYAMISLNVYLFSSIVLFTALALAKIFLSSFIRKYYVKIILKAFALTLPFIAANLLSFYANGILIEGMSSVVRIAAEIFIIIFFILYDISRHDKRHSFFIKSGLIGGGMTFVSLLCAQNIDADLRLGTVNGNPNVLAKVMVVLMVCFFIKYIIWKQKKWLILSLLSVLIGILTLSRNFLVCFLFFFGCVLLFRVLKEKYIKRSEFLIVFTLMLFVLLNVSTLLPSFLNTVKRLFSDSAGSGRIEIWTYYFKEWLLSAKYILFGIGDIDLHTWRTAMSFGLHASHNIFVEILCTRGVIGFLLFIAGFRRIFKVIKQKLSIQFSFFSMVVILTLMMMYFFETGINLVENWWFIFITLMTAFEIAVPVKAGEKEQEYQFET